MANDDRELDAQSTSEYEVTASLMLYRVSRGQGSRTLGVDLTTIKSIRFCVDGDVTVKFRRTTSGSFTDATSVSHPITSSYSGIGDSEGVTEVSFRDVKRGQCEILVNRSHREFTIGEQRARPPSDHVPLQTLHQRYLLTPFHSFVGARISAPTQHVRVLAYFPQDLLPDKVELVQIDSAGTVSTIGLRKECMKEEGLWILECDRPACPGGVYCVWRWEPELFDA
jgi:hypothetical protein